MCIYIYICIYILYIYSYIFIIHCLVLLLVIVGVMLISDAGDIQVEYTPTQENMADVLTKGLGTLKMEQLVNKIGLVSRPQKQEQEDTAMNA